jgi:hypothetical protein
MIEQCRGRQLCKGPRLRRIRPYLLLLSPLHTATTAAAAAPAVASWPGPAAAAALLPAWRLTPAAAAPGGGAAAAPALWPAAPRVMPLYDARGCACSNSMHSNRWKGLFSGLCNRGSFCTTQNALSDGQCSAATKMMLLVTNSLYCTVQRRSIHL